MTNVTSGTLQQRREAVAAEYEKHLEYYYQALCKSAKNKLDVDTIRVVPDSALGPPNTILWPALKAIQKLRIPVEPTLRGILEALGLSTEDASALFCRHTVRGMKVSGKEMMLRFRERARQKATLRQGRSTAL